MKNDNKRVGIRYFSGGDNGNAQDQYDRHLHRITSIYYAISVLVHEGLVNAEELNAKFDELPESIYPAIEGLIQVNETLKAIATANDPDNAEPLN